jgi:hypothetical protein
VRAIAKTFSYRSLTDPTPQPPSDPGRCATRTTLRLSSCETLKAAMPANLGSQTGSLNGANDGTYQAILGHGQRLS